MRHGMYVWSPKGGHVGTTSGSGGAEEFVTPQESQKAHLRAPNLDLEKLAIAPMETAGEVEVADTGLEGSEAGPDNPVRGLD